MNSFPRLQSLCFLLLLIGVADAVAGETKTAERPTYPRILITEVGSTTVHMPQIESWDGFETITARVAVEAREAGLGRIWYASLKIEGKTDIDFDERVVVVHDIRVIESVIADEGKPPEPIRKMVKDALPLEPRTVPLDTALRALPEDFVADPQWPGTAATISTEPPNIFVSTEPADLLLIHGKPVVAPVGDIELKYVVNTDWDLFQDEAHDRWYVRNGNAWLTSASLTDSKWKSTRDLPDALAKLPADEHWADARKAIPPPKLENKPARLLVSTKPAELILIDGKPKSEPVKELGLGWIANTKSDLFRYDGDYYYLVSGRWFTASSLKADWSAVETLPAVFAKIPEDHPRAHVLASVPGTEDARVAALEAQIPRTAKIRLDTELDVKIEYAGEPKFVPIEGTDLQRAANTTYQVILSDERYYLCHNAVWFVGDAPAGPWTVATEVPAGIYAIPATDPAHNVTYVYSDPASATTTNITYSYLPGYYGVHSYHNVVVYGTGYYYSPYYYYGSWGYPDYGYYYPPAYGNNNWYNPATGTYGSRSVNHGYDDVRSSTSFHNPNTGAYGRGNLYYDFDDREGWSERYVERGNRWAYSETDYTGNRARTDYKTGRGVEGQSVRVRQGDAITGGGTFQGDNRGGTTISRIDRNGAQVRITGEQGRSMDVTKNRGTRGSSVTTSTGGAGATARTSQGRVTVYKSGSGDLYAGRNGEVYRRDSKGWSGYSGNSTWQANRSARSSLSTQQRNNLNRQYQARTTGTRNYKSYQSQRSSMSSSRRSSMGSRSFRGGGRSGGGRSGGGRSGGGGRRR